VVTQNRSLDGVLTKLNSKDMTQFGSKAELEIDSEEEEEWQADNKEQLPGARKPATIKRRTKLAVRVTDVKFSPDGQSFACATTEGLLIYSLNDQIAFNPVEIDEGVTLDGIIERLKGEEYLTALLVRRKGLIRILDGL